MGELMLSDETSESPNPYDPREDPEYFGASDGSGSAWLAAQEEAQRERKARLVSAANRELAPHFEDEPPTEELLCAETAPPGA